MKQTLKYIYGIVFDNLKFAEAKHTLILTLASAVLAFATTFFAGNNIQTLLSIASIVFALIAIFYSFIALVARKVRVNKTHYKTDANLIYYKDIMRFNEITYIEAIKKTYDFIKLYKPDNFDYDLAKQIISVAKLAHIKFIYFNFAVIFLIASIICLILIVLLRGVI